MNKTELVQFVQSESGLKKKDAEAAVNAVLKGIETSLSEGQQVSLVGFGVFGVKERSERSGRNPQTGETITIPAAKVPNFRPGKSLKNAVG